jgi:hypothetical protein
LGILRLDLKVLAANAWLDAQETKLAGLNRQLILGSLSQRYAAFRIWFESGVCLQQWQLPGNPVAALTCFPVRDPSYSVAKDPRHSAKHLFGICQRDTTDEMNVHFIPFG